MKPTAWIALGLAVLCLTCVSCTRHHTLEREVNNPAQNRKVLIAAEDSAWKDALVNRVVTRLSVGGPFIKVVRMEKLPQTEVADYDVIVLVNSCKAWGLNARVQQFLETNPVHDRVILLTTLGDPDWNHPDLGVDTVTSASSMDNLTDMANNLTARINARLVGGAKE